MTTAKETKTTKAKPAAKAAKAEPKAAAKKSGGKYIAKTGKRKAAAAQVRLIENGSGQIIVNGKDVAAYFSATQTNTLMTPLKMTGMKSYDISVLVCGGGKVGQAEAVRHGITQALISINPEWRAALKAKGYVTRDARIKERKKPGLKRARKAPQWSKR